MGTTKKQSCGIEEQNLVNIVSPNFTCSILNTCWQLSTRQFDYCQVSYVSVTIIVLISKP